MNIEVFLTSNGLEEDDIRDRTVVVIDVLRACSTIATALHNGARAVVPVLDMAQASKVAANLDPSIYRLGGERGGEKIEGYHLGNSPLEYTREEVEGRDVILNTTNGTKALTRTRDARHLVAGSLLNAGRVVDFTKQAGADVTIVCAGRHNRISLEDTVCAGLLLDRLWNEVEPTFVSDAANAAYTLYKHDHPDVSTRLRRGNAVQLLLEMGFEQDVEYCFQVDALPVLPYYTDNRLVLYDSIQQRSRPDHRRASNV